MKPTQFDKMLLVAESMYEGQYRMMRDALLLRNRLRRGVILQTLGLNYDDLIDYAGFYDPEESKSGTETATRFRVGSEKEIEREDEDGCLILYELNYNVNSCTGIGFTLVTLESLQMGLTYDIKKVGESIFSDTIDEAREYLADMVYDMEDRVRGKQDFTVMKALGLPNRNELFSLLRYPNRYEMNKVEPPVIGRKIVEAAYALGWDGKEKDWLALGEKIANGTDKN